MTFMYVAEPNAIDVTDVADKIHQADLELVDGDPAFVSSHEQPFEILVIRSGTTVKDDIKEYFPQLQGIIRIGTGLDNVDLGFCKANNIAVYNAAGANAEAVAEYIVAITLYSMRKLHLLERTDIETWNRFKFEGQSLENKIIGIVGFGNIGRSLYKKLSGFTGIRFLTYDPYLTQEKLSGYDVKLVGLDELLQQSRIISLHLPLTNDTKHLINEQKLGLLQEDAILINAARGGIVDEQAVASLAKNKAFTYIADTVEDEPHVNAALLGHENIVITPHIASLTDSAAKAMVATAFDNFINGKHVAL